MGFVDSSFELDFKTALRPTRAGAEDYTIRAEDWNRLVQAAYDLKTAVLTTGGTISVSDIAGIATGTFLGRLTAGTGVAEALTATQATSMLNVATVLAKGLVPAPGASTGTVLKDNLAWASLAISDILGIPTSSLLGRATAGTGAAEALTGTQATSLLNVATASAKGLVPAFPNNTTTFYRGDGTYAVPAASSPAFSGCYMHNNNVAISVASNSATDLSFSTEVYDVGAYHTGSNTFFTVPTTGYYLVTAAVYWAAAGVTTGTRRLDILNIDTATTVARANIVDPGTTGSFIQTCTAIVLVTSGHRLKCQVTQVTGSALNATTEQNGANPAGGTGFRIALLGV